MGRAQLIYVYIDRMENLNLPCIYTIFSSTGQSTRDANLATT